VQANVERLPDITTALELGAEGVGLFRTELLYLDRHDLPTEDEQLEDAVAALKALRGRTATFRTLDIGAGKLPAGIRLPEGHNPALGIRSIRFSLRRPELLRTQLRALYRASAHGPLRIMFPLVATLAELRQAMALAAEVRRELVHARIPFNSEVPVGVMIETPSAAVTADHLARSCAFLSVGTNDLIQYTFAADRDNDDVAYLHRPLHPAVLRLLRLVVDAGRAAGKPVSLCGDMASNPTCVPVLVGLGLRELSMPGRSIAAVKGVIRRLRMIDAERLAVRALACDCDAAVEALVMETMHGPPPEPRPPHEEPPAVSEAAPSPGR
jgi:phosphotransferase system enzyme I (PtsI)